VIGIVIGVAGLIATIIGILITIRHKKTKNSQNPLIEPIMQHSQTNSEKGIYHYAINNLRSESVRLKEVRIKIWHPDGDEDEFTPNIQKVNRHIPPHPGSFEIDLEITFSNIYHKYSEENILKIMQMQPTFIVVNEDNKEFKFPAVQRSLW